ncbi:unnamed protein product [Durusdinium trenchii]|uniref:Uncharacterized protein n=1 Tax=Durusdinium trenchii TaxID=1381693 RepID=A0ABP0PXI0_9DINO
MASPEGLNGYSALELGHAARKSLARGDVQEALRAKEAKDVAERLLRCKDEELARKMAKAADRIDDETSLLWKLSRDFYLISRKKQIDLVERFVKGFVQLPSSEQAKAVLALAPRVRLARRGWAEGAKKSKDGRGRPSVRTGEESPKAGDLCFPPLVGARGRREADSSVVALLDQLDSSLRRLAVEDRERLHRRMDRAVSSSFSPIVLARMLAHLPSEEVHSIERWIVDEGALPPAAAARLFGALLNVQQAGGILQDVVDDVKVGAEELWVRLSEEFASQPEEISGSWSNWLKGRPPSPSAQSVIGDFDDDDAMSVTSRLSWAPSMASPSGRRSSVVSAQLGGGYSSSSAPRKRLSCQLHCPASLFLFSDKPIAGAFLGDGRRPSQELIDFVMVDVKKPSMDKTFIELDEAKEEALGADEVTDKAWSWS